MKTFAPRWRRLSPGTLQSALVLEHPHWLEERSVRALRALCGLFPLVLPGCFSQWFPQPCAPIRAQGKTEGARCGDTHVPYQAETRGWWIWGYPALRRKTPPPPPPPPNPNKQADKQTEWLLSVSVKFSGQLSLLCLPTAWSFRKPCSSQLLENFV